MRGKPMPGHISVDCQRFEITNNRQKYPFFLGAIDAKKLGQVSEAPSFEEQTSNWEIAREVLTPPTEHWQRPISEDKVQEIADRFDLEQEIMPNPVLLAVNPSHRITVREQENAQGYRTGLFTVAIPVPEDDNARKPLWIIDGQHRVNGLARTRNTNSPIPFVLLYSPEDAYRPEMLAKIFAQVSTEADPLHDIHKAWMQFVFNLGEYESATPAWRAMRTTAILCSTQSFSSINNPFLNNIRFNPELSPKTITPGGFSFDATELKDLLTRWYFKNPGGEFPLTEDDVAKEISLAVHALKGVVKRDVKQSAFFGDFGYEQRYFRDAFIAGVCEYLLKHGAPRDWNIVLKDLNFDQSIWDVSDWVNSTQGRAGTISKNLAFACFTKIFSDGVLPPKVANVCEYLQGDESSLKVEYRLLDDDDKFIPNTAKTFELKLTGGLAKRVEDLPSKARWIKITSPCTNVGPVEITLKSDSFDEKYYFKEFKRGRIFKPQELSKLRHKIILNIKADFYGDNTIKKELQFNVRD